MESGSIKVERRDSGIIGIWLRSRVCSGTYVAGKVSFTVLSGYRWKIFRYH